jgi:hypothetical protein
MGKNEEKTFAPAIPVVFRTPIFTSESPVFATFTLL